MVKLEGRISPKRLYGNIYRVPSDGSGGPLQAKTVYPNHDEQIIAPDEDFYGLALVTVKPVPRKPAGVSMAMGGTAHLNNPVSVEVNMPVSVRAMLREPTFSYRVVSVEGASYSFGSGAYYEDEIGNIGENPSGYFYSGNSGKSSSYAIGKIEFVSDRERTVILHCVNYAEANYDYGTISQVDQMLGLSSGYDGASGTEKVLKTFQGQSSNSVVPVEITIPEGEHFVCVKFVKDSSGNSGNDSLKFSIEVQ